MKKRTIFGKVSKIVFLGIFFGLFALPTDAFCSDLTVLILHSYSQEYPWTKKEHDGFVSSLNKEHHDCNHSISTESLDSKRVPFTEEYQHFFFRYLKAKYENFKPDFIFCTDDNALIFLMRYKSELFPEAPVVFCGVNDTLLTTKLDRHQFVGVLEVKEIIPNLALAQKLRPGLRKVFIIGDDSSTYRAIKERILQDFQGRFPGMELEFLANQQLAPIVEKLSTEQTGILVLSTIGGLHNARGEIMPLHRSIKKIQDAGNFIVMSMEDAYVIGGVLGGVVTSGQLQGKAAALLAEKLIKGIAAESIPLVEKSPNLPLFDFRQIKRFAVSEAILPEGSVFLHRPETIYQQHKKEVLTALAVFALLVIVLAILSVNVLRRKRAEQSLKESEKRYREIYNSPNDAIFIHDGETGKVLDVNESMLEMYGYHRDEALRLTIDDLSSGEEPYSQHEAEGRIRAALEKEPQIFEWLAKKKSGE
ncbi:MAG: PAS domain-containing protein, partial [Desulfobulbaceae bacterium]|nr:PAS domain-containing protein [Desulfobulbaceae bacterium]